MFEDIIKDAWTQLGFISLFSFSGWAVAFILYKENKKLMFKYAELMSSVIQHNIETRHLIAQLGEALNIESLLKEYLK